MKLLVQRVVRATVEVDGFIEGRIGHGLVLQLALRKGDSAAKLRSLAARIVKLKLWPEPMLPDVPWQTSAQDSGKEILVILQQSLIASIPGLTPEDGAALSVDEARPIFDSFVQALQKEYQEEMVVAAPVDADAESLRVETTLDGAMSFFELAGEAVPAPSASSAATRPLLAMRAKVEPASPAPESGVLEPNVAAVTQALRQIPRMSKSKALLDSVRVFRIMSLKMFQAALTEAEQAEADAFAEALDAAAPHFSQKQRDQIAAWMGHEFTALPAAEAAAAFEDEEEQDDEVDGQLAQLRMETIDPRRLAEKKRSLAEMAGAQATRGGISHTARPPWTAGKGAKGAVGKGFGKGYSKGYSKGPRPPRRQWGIAPLDESARMHGQSADPYRYGQTAAFSERQLRFGITAKQEYDEADDEPEHKRRAAAPRLPKGTPTLAPITPAPTASDDIEEL